MKRIILIFSCILALAAASFAQKEPCETVPVQMAGQVVGLDYESQRIIRLGQERVYVYEVHRQVGYDVRLNSFGFFNVTVNSCDYILVQPYAVSKFIAGADIYSPTQFFRYVDGSQAYYFLTFEMSILR